MKYGLIYYHDTENVGDDILSYAAKQFLPRVDYYIDREALNLFVPDKKEYVAAILNGWYLHYRYEFPPSPYLLPLFTGTHFSKDIWIFGDYSYLDGAAAGYLKLHSPIGCRDMQTHSVLTQRGIDCYFSGCLTLTLQKNPGIPDSHAVILTDVSDEVASYVQSLLPDRQILRMTHRLPSDERGADWPVREARVVSYLSAYQAADLVITSRLHCALPSTALGTPAILIGKYDEDYQNRLSDYASYCVSVSEEDLLEHRADDAIQAILAAATIPVPDPRPALPGIQSTSALADRLAKRCREYIRSVAEQEPEPSELPEPSLYRQLYVDRTAYMRRSLGHLLYRCQQYELQHIHDMTVMNQVLATAQKVFEMK